MSKCSNRIREKKKEKKTIACCVYEIIARPVACTYICSCISHHIFIMIYSWKWYFIKIRISRNYKSFLKNKININAISCIKYEYRNIRNVNKYKCKNWPLRFSHLCNYLLIPQEISKKESLIYSNISMMILTIVYVFYVRLLQFSMHRLLSANICIIWIKIWIKSQMLNL